ncbi:hypothetical protein ONZ45_g11904 [Pleurotus djamor]|nr:hypothetical protein ONZ45_g11904 [Pleurotus djamor]
MHLWDLGFTPSAEPLPEPMVNSLGVLFLVITKTDLLPTQSLLEVYEMYPDSAVLHRLASWSLSGEPLKQVHSTVHFAGSYVIMGYPARDGGGEILVWNYTDNTAAKWNIDFVNENDEFSIHDGHVILVGEDSITVWKIPRLHARIPGVDVHREHNLPSASIEHGGFRTLHAAYRQPNSLKGFHVDVFADAVADRMCRLKRYVVTAPSGVEENPLVSPREPSIFPILLGESPIPPEDQSDDDHYLSTWLTDQEIVIFRSEHERWSVRANAIAQPSPFGYPEEKAAYGMLSLGSPPDKSEVGGLIQTPSCAVFALCPATGRACVVDGNDIRILDYLSP